MVRGVGAVDRDAAAMAPRGGDHGERVTAPHLGAHLGEEVEIVLDQQDDFRPDAIERGVERGGAGLEGCIEQRDVMPLLAQDRGGEQRCQRRIGFLTI